MTAEELQGLANSLEFEDLVDHLNRLSRGDTMEDWGGRGEALEYLFLRAFALELGSARVTWPYRVSPDLDVEGVGTLEQIDGAIYLDEVAALVEAKCTKKRVDVDPLAKLRFRLEHRPPGTLGFLVSWTGFSPQARVYADFATPLNVLLWDGPDLLRAIPERKLVQAATLKWRAAVELKMAYAVLETAWAAE